jgi:hypothetical protein
MTRYEMTTDKITRDEMIGDEKTRKEMTGAGFFKGLLSVLRVLSRFKKDFLRVFCDFSVVFFMFFVIEIVIVTVIGMNVRLR